MNRPFSRQKIVRAFPALCWFVLLLAFGGCNFLPDVRHKPQFHNPFPQLQTVAVLPFRNQSQEATVSGSRVTLAYYNELQSIPGFEVIPVGVVESQLLVFEEQVLGRPASRPEDFQRFAKHLGVDAVLQGSITDFQSYYPPRMTLKVNWYAANEGYHPIPPGYGLPWGTKAEKKIPETVRLESERALAREQLKTQTPLVESESDRQRIAKGATQANLSPLARSSGRGPRVMVRRTPAVLNQQPDYKPTTRSFRLPIYKFFHPHPMRR